MNEEPRRREIRMGNTGLKIIVIEEPRFGFNTFRVECATPDYLRASQLVAAAPRARVKVQTKRGHPKGELHLFVSSGQFDDAVGLIERSPEESEAK